MTESEKNEAKRRHRQVWKYSMLKVRAAFRAYQGEQGTCVLRNNELLKIGI